MCLVEKNKTTKVSKLLSVLKHFKLRSNFGIINNWKVVYCHKILDENCTQKELSTRGYLQNNPSQLSNHFIF